MGLRMVIATERTMPSTSRTKLATIEIIVAGIARTERTIHVTSPSWRSRDAVAEAPPERGAPTVRDARLS